MFYNCMDLGPVVLNYDIYIYIYIYSKEFQKPTHGATISNNENGQMVYIYIVYVMHAVSDFFYHMVVIFITSIYMVLMMSPCALVCGVVW